MELTSKWSLVTGSYRHNQAQGFLLGFTSKKTMLVVFVLTLLAFRQSYAKYAKVNQDNHNEQEKDEYEDAKKDDKQRDSPSNQEKHVKEHRKHKANELSNSGTRERETELKAKMSSQVNSSEATGISAQSINQPQSIEMHADVSSVKNSNFPDGLQTIQGNPKKSKNFAKNESDGMSTIKKIMIAIVVVLVGVAMMYGVLIIIGMIRHSKQEITSKKSKDDKSEKHKDRNYLMVGTKVGSKDEESVQNDSSTAFAPLISPSVIESVEETITKSKSKKGKSRSNSKQSTENENKTNKSASQGTERGSKKENKRKRSKSASTREKKSKLRNSSKNHFNSSNGST